MKNILTALLALTLFISCSGYGSFNYNGIPGGSVLIFDVNLISVNSNPAN